MTEKQQDKMFRLINDLVLRDGRRIEKGVYREANWPASIPKPASAVEYVPPVKGMKKGAEPLPEAEPEELPKKQDDGVGDLPEQESLFDLGRQQTKTAKEALKK